MIKKPKRLVPGDLVAVLSPSWGGPHVFPEVYEEGLKILRDWGLRIQEYSTTRASPEFLTAHPQERAHNLNEAFRNSEVKAIFTSIGGNDSISILSYLDKEVIRNNPKIFLGYSDITTLHIFCNQLGLVTFHGPTVMAGLSQIKSLPSTFKQHAQDILFGANAPYNYVPYQQYCDGYPDWSEGSSIGKVNQLKKSNGWNWLQGSGTIQGAFTGGCLEVLNQLETSSFWPPHNFWIDKILCLETSEDKPSVEILAQTLRRFGNAGMFEILRGIIIGRARDYSETEKALLDAVAVQVIKKEFKEPNIPLVTNFDFGHTDPQLILPFGSKVEIDCDRQKIQLIEPWFFLS